MFLPLINIGFAPPQGKERPIFLPRFHDGPSDVPVTIRPPPGFYSSIDRVGGLHLLRPRCRLCRIATSVSGLVYSLAETRSARIESYDAYFSLSV